MVGVFMLFRIKQAEIRQEVKSQIKAGVPDGQITVLRFDTRLKNDLRWVEDHEFFYEDHMYDVVKTTREEHFILYHCLPDTLETRLFKNLNKTVASEMNRDKSKSGQSNFLPVNWYFSDLQFVQFAETYMSNEISSPYCFAVISEIDTPEPPPPKG